jgi:hypothetical protein
MWPLGQPSAGRTAAQDNETVLSVETTEELQLSMLRLQPWYLQESPSQALNPAPVVFPAAD